MTGTVIVTGASGGIGSAICENFASRGHEVVGIDIVPSDWTGGEVYDLFDSNLAQRVRSERQVSDLEVIVHCAALQVLRPLAELTRGEWENSLEVNIFSLDRLVKEFAPELKENSGAVVLIGSIHSMLSRVDTGVYAVSKGAAESWVRAAALSYAPGFRVNSVVPGAVSSGKLDEQISSLGPAGSDYLKKIASRTPLGRIGTPAEIAEAVSFLAGDRALFITGQSLVVDGGASRVLATEVQ